MKKFFPLSLIIIIFLALGKQLLWTATVPIWQAPDEQAHFAQLQYYAENKTLTLGSENLSSEVAISEQLLGTYRDTSGNNQYTYHPAFNIPYSNTTVGLNENAINNLPDSSRTTYVGQEAAAYPPLYYILDLPFYNAVYSHGLIDRVFSARLLSLVLNIFLVITAYVIGKTIWGKGIMPVTLAAMVAFQPMVSFVSAGVHPDNLLNLLYSLGLLLLLLLLKNGNKLRYLVFLALVIVLGLETKQLMFLFIPLAGAVFLWRTRLGKLRFILAAIVLVAPILVFIFQLKLPFVPYVSPTSPLAGMNFLDYLHFRIPKLTFEVWPWYWGVFKWLGVTLPPLVLKIITRLAALAVLGLVVKLVIIIRQRAVNFEFKALVLFIISSLSYVTYLLFWDWRLMQANGFSQGLQGRYFFPNIIGHMALFLIGLTVIKRLQKPVAIGLILGFFVLNIVALQTVAGSYYDFSSWHRLLIQLAQYKPGVVKLFATI